MPHDRLACEICVSCCILVGLVEVEPCWSEHGAHLRHRMWGKRALPHKVAMSYRGVHRVSVLRSGVAEQV
jgi:hypothetical protein